MAHYYRVVTNSQSLLCDCFCKQMGNNMNKFILLTVCFLLTGCVYTPIDLITDVVDYLSPEEPQTPPTTNTTEPISSQEQNITEPLKECDNTCKKFSDDELLNFATIIYTGTTLKTDYDSNLNICTSATLLKNLSKINKTTFIICLKSLAESTVTGYNSTIEYLINKDFTNFFNVAIRCASVQYDKIPVEYIAYTNCI